MAHPLFRARFLAALVLLGFGALPCLAQCEYWIDPVNGNDTRGTGSMSAPFQTMTHAASVCTTPPLVLHLARGTYSTASGERFPVVLPGQVVVSGPAEGGAFIDDSMLNGFPKTVFKIDSVPATGSPFAVFERFRLETAQRAIQVQNPAAVSGLQVFCRDLDILAWRGIVMTGSGAGTAVLLVERCIIDSFEDGIRLDASTGRQMYAEVLQCRFRSSSLTPGISAAIDGHSSSVTLRVSSSLFRECGQGIRTDTLAGGQIHTTVSGCAFLDSGWTSFPPSSSFGGIIDLGNGAQHTIANTIFLGSTFDFDMPQHDLQRYTLASILSQQPSLASVPGVTIADPMFVDPVGEDYRLLPGSPAIDAGSNLFLPPTYVEDLLGRPRVDCGGASIVDIGPIESSPREVWFTKAPRIGKTTRLRTIGVSGAPPTLYAVLVGGPPALGTPPCSGFVLQSPATTPLAAGVLPAIGLAEKDVAVPATPGLAGLALGLQSLYLENGTSITFSDAAPTYVIGK